LPLLENTFSLGQTASYTKTFTSADIEIFAALSGDHNPIHLDEQYATTTRFGKRIAHGMLTASLISTVIGMQLPGTGAIYLSQELKFLKPVFIGDTVTARASIIELNPAKQILLLKTECTNQTAELVITGTAKILYAPIT
jgi:3-hydroxybutyryl-CoA dehydratase